MSPVLRHFLGLLCLLSLSQAQPSVIPADQVLHGWQPTSLSAYPGDQYLLLLDDYTWIRTIQSPARFTGRVAFNLSNNSPIEYIAAAPQHRVWLATRHLPVIANRWTYDLLYVDLDTNKVVANVSIESIITGLAVNSQGTLYVLGEKNQSLHVEIVTPTGQLAGNFPLDGYSSNQLLITLDSADTLWIAPRNRTGNLTVSHYSPKGQLLERIMLPPTSRPYYNLTGMVVDAQGTLWLMVRDSQSLITFESIRYNITGGLFTSVRLPRSPFTNPTPVGVESNLSTWIGMTRFNDSLLYFLGLLGDYTIASIDTQTGRFGTSIVSPVATGIFVGLGATSRGLVTLSRYNIQNPFPDYSLIGIDSTSGKDLGLRHYLNSVPYSLSVDRIGQSDETVYVSQCSLRTSCAVSIYQNFNRINRTEIGVGGRIRVHGKTMLILSNSGISNTSIYEYNVNGEYRNQYQLGADIRQAIDFERISADGDFYFIIADRERRSLITQWSNGTRGAVIRLPQPLTAVALKFSSKTGRLYLTAESRYTQGSVLVYSPEGVLMHYLVSPPEWAGLVKEFTGLTLDEEGNVFALGRDLRLKGIFGWWGIDRMGAQSSVEMS